MLLNVPDVCPRCDGTRRILVPIRRSWWDILLQRPAASERLCHACKGIGVIPSSAQEEKRLEERMRSQHQQWLSTLESPADRRIRLEREKLEQQQRERAVRKRAEWLNWLRTQPGYRSGGANSFECAICKKKGTDSTFCEDCSAWFCSDHSLYTEYDGNVGHWVCPHCRRVLDSP
jgi:hypothetical protein